MPTKTGKHSDTQASAMRELAAGNRTAVARRQSNPGEGAGPGHDLMDVFERLDASDYKRGGQAMNVKSDKNGNPI